MNTVRTCRQKSTLYTVNRQHKTGTRDSRYCLYFCLKGKTNVTAKGLFSYIFSSRMTPKIVLPVLKSTQAIIDDNTSPNSVAFTLKTSPKIKRLRKIIKTVKKTPTTMVKSNLCRRYFLFSKKTLEKTKTNETK